MNRNVESHFALNPTNIDISRSTFDRSHSLKTSFDVGQVVPFYCDEVLPGDTFHVKSSKVVRLQTLLTPMMDNIYLDTYFYFVPNRLVWEHWKEFCGENNESAWIPTTEYQVPQITSPAGGWNVGTLADYFGIPTGVPNLSVNALPFRAYALIMDEWFRDENIMDPLLIPKDDSTIAGTNGAFSVENVAKGGAPFIACKYHDYFTSALPSPQKGPDVTIPIATAGPVPVVANVDKHDLGNSPLSFNQVGGAGTVNNGYYALGVNKASNTSAVLRSSTSPSTAPSNYYQFTPDNLWADFDGSASAASINQLRMAFQIQKFYEKDARGGTRYIELLKSHFGVTSPDARLQRPEYLGGNRVPITINQVIQQSGTESTGTPQGNVAGMSVTTDVNGDFIHSFVEHGFVIGVMVARYDHTYQQGIERFWSRKSRFDYYWPVFANIGEQAILNKEIFAQGSDVVNSSSGKPYDDEVFGYQEAWADYRYKPNHVTGEMRSQYSQSLDFWHLGDDYDALPHLSPSWLQENKETVDRVLAVSSRLSNQLFADIYIENRCTRPMPLYSIPGLIDHH